jgi:wobble nucleotide-excising tRNase
MREYQELTSAEQGKAEGKALDSLLQAIVEGTLRFNDQRNHDDLQARIDAAQQKAEGMQTPWFAGEYIMETCRDDLQNMAQCDAIGAFYPDPTETIIQL